MRVGIDQLRSILFHNVAEILFERRNPKPGAPLFRRMLCTNSVPLLESRLGKDVLHYKRPRRPPHFNPRSANVVITWDIFMQDFRCVNMDNCELIKTIPANEEFWAYFNEYIIRMTTEEKMVFMDS